MSEDSNDWKFSQCFGDKAELDEISDGIAFIVLNWYSSDSLVV